jgi:AcrB/AcrD/AcrF family
MLADLIENAIRRQIPKQEVQGIVDNIGLPYSQMNFMSSTSGVIGASDADVIVTLNAKHRPTADYVRTLRTILPRQFSGTTFYFLPADMVTQILNFGLPAPVDLQIEGQDQASNHELATRVLGELRHVPGLTDLRIQQPVDYPMFNIKVDRTKAAIGGYTDQDVNNSLLVALSGSFQTIPNFFLNWHNGVQYELISQTPQYRIQSLQGVGNIPSLRQLWRVLKSCPRLPRCAAATKSKRLITITSAALLISLALSRIAISRLSDGTSLASSTTIRNSSRAGVFFAYAASLKRCEPHMKDCWQAWLLRSFSFIS